MNRHEYMHLLAERDALQRMIADTPVEEAIDRLSLESRLAVIDEQIAQAVVNEREPARARLTFRGRPVIGSHGIFADFGMKAVSSFTEAVTTIAASLEVQLAAVGRIPNREQNQLLITSTAVGSFGFDLEEYRRGQLPLVEQSAVERALELTQSLLQGTIEENDELLADAAAELDRRALERVRDFIKTLADNDAVCALSFRNHLFRFRDVDQVRRSFERLSHENLTEEEVTLEVQFLGALPHRRSFEFRLLGSEEILFGKISAGVEQLDAINDHRHQTVRARMMVTRVGNGRPRYSLLAMPDWDGAA